jgi:hypothetical protein
MKGEVKEIYLLEENWYHKFKFFSREAAAIIVDADFSSPS